MREQEEGLLYGSTRLRYKYHDIFFGYLEPLEIFRKKMAVSRYFGHFLVIWTEFPTFVSVNCYIYTSVTFFYTSITNG